MSPISLAEFEARYRADPDPWGYTSSAYEREKYEATLAACGPGPFRQRTRAGQPRSGVFSAQLAPRCHSLTTIEGAPTAVQAARRRLRRTLRRESCIGAIPDAIPRRPYDLVVASEILYYLVRGRPRCDAGPAAGIAGARRPAGGRALATSGTRASVHRRAGARLDARRAMACPCTRDHKRLPARRAGAPDGQTYAARDRRRAAALSAARAFREAGGQGAAALVARRAPDPLQPSAAEQGPPAGGDQRRSAPARGRDDWFHEHGTDLVGGRAMALDAGSARSAVVGRPGAGYRHCLLATGAEPTRLPIPGSESRGPGPALLDDLRDLQRRLEPAVTVTAIGSGFIGCEIAASLQVCLTIG